MSQKVLLRSSAPPASAGAAGASAASVVSSPSPAASSGGGSSSKAAAGPQKLLNEGFELLLEEAGQQLSDTNDFTVIGVLGGQGVGKSTIMSLLAGAPWAGAAAEAAGGASLHEPPFPAQPTEVALQAAHQTCGIDLFVTSERLILLDTQPLLSPSVLLDFQRREAALPAEATTYENLLELQALRLAMLLLSCCHLVVCVHDVQLDPLGLRTLRLAQMLRHRLPDLSHLALATPQAAQAAAAAAAVGVATETSERYVEPAPVVEYSPRLAFLFNRLPSAAFGPHAQTALRRALGQLFPPPSALSSSTEAATPSAEAGGLATGSTVAERVASDGVRAPIEADDALVLLLPEAETAPGLSRVSRSTTSHRLPPPPTAERLRVPSACGAQVSGAHLGFRAEAEAARDALLSHRRTHFARSLTEREWLRGVGRMWELLKRSALLADYNRQAQKMHAYA